MISVVMCSVDDGRFDAALRHYEQLLGGVDFEIVRIADARSLAEGYNRGLARSKGEIVAFSHDDVEFLAPDFAARLLDHMRHCDVLGVVGTRKLGGPEWYTAGYPYLYGQTACPRKNLRDFLIYHYHVPARRVDKIQALDGQFLCARREVVEAVAFDEVTFDAFHLYDIDFTYRAFRSGLRVSVACDLFPLHESSGDYGPEWKRYADAFLAKSGVVHEPCRPYTPAAMVVSSRAEIVAAMTHAHWGD
jgi:hypothetical protein